MLANELFAASYIYCTAHRHSGALNSDCGAVADNARDLEFNNKLHEDILPACRYSVHFFGAVETTEITLLLMLSRHRPSQFAHKHTGVASRLHFTTHIKEALITAALTV